MGSMVRLLVGSLLASMCAVAGPPEPGPVAPTMAHDGGATARGSAGAASSVRGGGALTPAPEEVAGLASVDACPDEPEAVNGFQDADGCPDVVPQELAAILGVVEGVTFDLDKDVIRLATSRAEHSGISRLARGRERAPDRQGLRREQADRHRSDAERAQAQPSDRALAAALIRAGSHRRLSVLLR